MCKFLERSIFFLLAALFLLLPFHAFLVTTTNYFFFEPGVNPPLYLSVWKDAIVALICFLILLYYLHHRRWFVFDQMDALLGMFFLLGAIVWSFNSGGVSDKAILASLKYNFSFLIFFLFLKHYGLSLVEKKKLIKILTVSASIAMFIGLLLFVTASYRYLINIGYSPRPSTYFADRPVAFCQYISGTEVCRNQATFSGPNQFASFLLILIPLFASLAAFFDVKQEPKGYLQKGMYLLRRFFFYIFHIHRDDDDPKEIRSRRIYGILFGFALVSLLLTFTRSAWIGAAVTAALFFYFFAKDKKFFWLVSASAVLGVGIANALIWFLDNESFHAFIVRASSSAGHLTESLEGMKMLLAQPFGYGLASAGPASRFLIEAGVVLPENWYLQVGLELGILGMILFLVILYRNAKHMFASYLATKEVFYKRIHISLLFSLIALSLMGFLLHVWEDSTTALIFWGLAGIMYKEVD